jgi:hypothetical protein
MRGSSKIDPGLVRPKSDPKVSNDERKGLADLCYVVCFNAAIIPAQQRRQPKVPLLCRPPMAISSYQEQQSITASTSAVDAHQRGACLSPLYADGR